MRLEGPPGLELYENRSWIPQAAALPPNQVPRGEAGSDRPGHRCTASRVRCGTASRVPAGAIVWSQSYNGAWSASSNGEDAAAPARCSGGPTATPSTSPGPVSFSYGDQWQRYPVVLIELGLVVGAFLLWRGSARFKLPFRRPSDPEVAVVSPRSGRRARIVVIVIVLGCLLVAAILDRQRLDDSTPTTSVVALGPRVPAANAVETAWYCAEGSANPDGRADERLYIANVDDRAARARISVMQGPDVAPKVTDVDVAAGSVATVRVGDILPIAEPGVLVEVTGARAVVTHSITGNGDAGVGPCARDASPRVALRRRRRR